VTPSPDELKKAEERAKNIVNKYADLCMPKQEAWNELEFMIQEALRRQTRDVLDLPEVQALADECEVHGEGGKCEDCPTALANFQRFRGENSK
jgi:hypothetical protein